MTKHSLAHCELTAIPFETMDHEATTEIIVANNDIGRIPRDITMYVNLEELHISNNLLRLIPADLSQHCKSLRVLCMNSNKLASMAVERARLDRLPNLERLEIADNRLTEFPQSLCDIPSLKKLNLSSNKLSLLPAKFSNLKNLESLGLAFNNFNGLPVTTLEKLGSLKVLTFIGNSMQENTHEDLKKLSALVIGIAEISEIKDSYDDLEQAFHKMLPPKQGSEKSDVSGNLKASSTDLGGAQVTTTS